MAKRGLKTGKLGKKSLNHDTYAKPISINKIVLQFLKYDSYKPKQEKIINYIKDHQHCIVIQPTNFGKSLSQNLFPLNAHAKMNFVIVSGV